MSKKIFSLLFRISGLVILVILLGNTLDNAYAKQFVAPPDVPRSEIRDGTFFAEIKSGARPAVELPEPARQFKEFGNLRAELGPLYTTVDDPALHVVNPGAGLEGVGDLLITIPSEATFRCSGTLLPTGLHVLTAAHCVTNASAVLEPGTTGDVLFETTSGDVIIGFAKFEVHPSWDGDSFRGNDVAVIELVFTAPGFIPRHDIDRDDTNDLGFPFVKSGYGRAGFGSVGDTIPSGVKRQGENIYDDIADTMLLALGLTSGVDFVSGSVLQYDFDNGLAANDAFDFFFGIPELGLANLEVMSAPGDSGGPTFDGSIITGITSYGVTLNCGQFCTSDVTLTGGPPFSAGFPILDSSFGEFAGDTRVSAYFDWIDLATSNLIFCGRDVIEFDRVIIGTAGDDVLGGTNGDDLIDGKEGNDSIQGHGGNDCLIGGDGLDTLSGGDGNDFLQGDAGADSLKGGLGDDTLFGGAGDDRISGGAGNDELHGGSGNDQLAGRVGNDVLFGDDDNDILSGGLGDDTIFGGLGDDFLYGREGVNTMTDVDGNNVCIDGTGVSTIYVTCAAPAPLFSTLDLKAYYKFNEAEGNIINQASEVGSTSEPSNSDLVPNGIIYGSDGLIGNDVSLTTNDDMKMSSTTISDWRFLHSSGEKWSLIIWYQADNFSQDFSFIATTNHNGGDVGTAIRINPDRTIAFFFGKTGTDRIDYTTTFTVPNDSNYHMFYASYDDTTGDLKVSIDDGTVETDGGNDLTHTASDSESFPYIGSLMGTGSFSKGDYDEVSIWNRVLTTAEITDLFNAGNGLEL